MHRILIVSPETGHVRELAKELSDRGLACSVVSHDGHDGDLLSGILPDLTMVELDGAPPGSSIWGLPARVRSEWHSPVIVLVSKSSLGYLDTPGQVDDFVVEPWDTDEVMARISRALGKGRSDTGELIRRGDLVIDTGRFEVTIGGRPVELTFREYELLRFLASNRGRVFTREVLLNRVWGYDFYGGDRTVDVHVRRLRSKLEDAEHIFIETVRNVGYRFIGGEQAC